jgi:dethiobiotin synthetase
MTFASSSRLWSLLLNRCPHQPQPFMPETRPVRFFVTGTDTGIGKTLVSALLCAALDACYWKPIQTGSREGTDRRTVIKIAQLPLGRALPEIYLFAPPVSPHLAARRAGVRIELKKISMPALEKSDALIVEGAGGALVPINRNQLMTHLMHHLKLPVVVIARTALGTINHTLLTLAALRAAHLDIRGVVLCGEPNPENRKAIEHYGNVQVIGDVPLLKTINRRTLLEVFRTRFDGTAFRG